MAKAFAKLRGIPDRVLSQVLQNNALYTVSLLRFRKAQQRGNIVITIWLTLLTLWMVFGVR